MKAQKILFPTDFSDPGDSSLKYATALARDTGAKLLIVHVEEPLSVYGGAGDVFYAAPEPDDVSIRQRLEGVVPADPAVAYEHYLVTGDPATEIVRLAEEEHADLIVMSTHGRSGLLRLLMGSVAEAVVRRASCPVFTLKQPHEAPVESS